jgi:CPA2 family monovalent cation:H+ antiporter-2
MIMTPLISSQTSRLYALKKKWFRHEPLESVNIPEEGLLDHVVIAGSGRVGFRIAEVLKRLDVSFVLVELDQQRVEQAKEAGFPVVYGDGSHHIVLDALSVETASLLVVTIPSIVTAQAIIKQARKLNQQMRVVARISEPEFFEVFKELRVNDLVYPEFEAGLEMTRQVLFHLHLTPSEIQRQTETMRQEFLAPQLTDGEHFRTLGQLCAADLQFDLEWIRLEPDNTLIDRSIGEAAIRRNTGASVVGVMRNKELTPNPGPEFRFQKNDMVAIIGSETARQAFRFFQPVVA